MSTASSSESAVVLRPGHLFTVGTDSALGARWWIIEAQADGTVKVREWHRENPVSGPED